MVPPGAPAPQPAMSRKLLDRSAPLLVLLMAVAAPAASGQAAGGSADSFQGGGGGGGGGGTAVRPTRAPSDDADLDDLPF